MSSIRTFRTSTRTRSSMGPARASTRGKRPSQLSLPGFAPRLEHGGGLRKGRRKLARPLDPKRPIHVTMRSSLARGKLSLVINSRPLEIERLKARYSRKFQVRVYRMANAGSHLHLVVQGKTRQGLQAFFRAFSGSVARLVTQARKGSRFGRFWDELLYTKVLSWGPQFKAALEYVRLNEMESWGVWHRSWSKRALARGHPAPG